LPYLQLPVEENPFLGVRAIRLCFSHDELFATQLRAILRAGHGRDLRIMFPMIANLADLDRATERLEKVHRDLEQENIPHLWPVKTGIMIEIPSAAILAETLAAQTDFFSIGTNDLTQYTLAIDRQNPELAAEADGLHPAVLRLIAQTVAGAQKHGRWVGVCGGTAGDPFGAQLLAGLGVDELSMTPRDIPAVKARLRNTSFPELQALATRALAADSAAEIRALDTGA
jgi:phosphocarrier protein FPr